MPFHFYGIIGFLGLCLYLAECFLWVGAESWLFLTWFDKFDWVRGPAIRFRNFWPEGFAYRFPPEDFKPALPLNLSVRDARERWEAYGSRARTLNWLSQGLLMLVMVGLSIYILRRGSLMAWAILGALFLLIHLVIGVLFWRAHRKLYQGRKGFLKGVLLCFASPWQSSRAGDLLGLNLFRDFHPLAVARTLLPQEPFLSFSRRWILELRYPSQRPQAQRGIPLLLKPNAMEEEKKLLEWFSKLKLSPEDFLAPPKPSHPSHLSYCRRCDTEYAIATGLCNDCGRDLTAF